MAKLKRRYVLIAALAGLAFGATIGGGGSGLAASTGVSVVDYSQCANGKPNAGNDPTTCNAGWINGILNANNSQYHEDQVTAQRLVIEIPAGNTVSDHTITLRYLWNKSSHHAYDSLARWDTTITGVTTASAICAGVPGGPNGCPASGSPTITTSQVPSSSCSAGHELSDRNLKLYGGTITSITAPVNDSASCSLSADEFETVVVHYTAPAGTRVMLLFGGHLAASAGANGWGAGSGSAFINGGPYHIKLDALDGASAGNRDNQITAGAILTFAPSITTTLSSSSISVGGSVSDSATLTGATSNAGGTVTYTVYDNNTCTSNANDRDAGTKTVTNGVVPNSNSLTFNSAGTFYWQAAYSGDGVNQPVTSACTSEALVVNKANSTISTAEDLVPNDSATVPSDATGTVDFYLFKPGDTCSVANEATAVYHEQATVSSGGAQTTNTGAGEQDTDTLAGSHAAAVGTWLWLAVYSGDGKYNGSDNIVSGTCNESFSISS